MRGNYGTARGKERGNDEKDGRIKTIPAAVPGIRYSSQPSSGFYYLATLKLLPINDSWFPGFFSTTVRSSDVEF